MPREFCVSCCSMERRVTEAEVITTVCGLGGLVISIWSLQVARRAERGQREAALAANVHERRNSAAMHLQKYSDLLAEVRDATKAAKQEIHTCADDVLMNLAYLVDDVAVHNPPRHSRHASLENSRWLRKLVAQIAVDSRRPRPPTRRIRRAPIKLLTGIGPTFRDSPDHCA